MARAFVHDPADTAERFAAILRQLSAVKNPARVRKAYEEALFLYDGRVHWTGDVMMSHVLGALEQLAAFSPDDDAVIACLFSHAVGPEDVSLDELSDTYGSSVRALVGDLHVLLRMTDGDKRLSLTGMRRMIVGRVGDDVRVIYLFLCDRIAALHRLAYLPPEMRKQYCRDALLLYAPIATRFGAYALKHAMESRAFPVVYPSDALRIAEQLSRLHEQHGYFLDDAASALARFLQTEGVRAEVHGRQKQPYSIFRKMQNKNVNHIEDIYDLFALRVVVEDVPLCYQVLGLLHRIGHPVANRFKDYIAFPKPNGYQSLHTTLAQLPWMPDNLMLEVQIRTREMHHEADIGMAAHWMYKSFDALQTTVARDATWQAKRPPVQHILSPAEAEDREGEQIFVLTPQGDIVELPDGASPLDFAFQVHTDLGLTYRGARVNGVGVPLDHPLENGDVVEIIRASHPQPSSKWMSVLKTASARRRLRQYLAEKERPAYIDRGRELLNEYLRSVHVAPLDPKLSILKMVDGRMLSVTEREDVLAKLGQGAQSVASLMRHIDALKPSLQPVETIDDATTDDLPLSAVELDDAIPMPMRFARCCEPEHAPRGSIAGVVSRTGTVRIHRRQCVLLKNVNPERLIDAHWTTVGHDKLKIENGKL